MAPKNPNDTIGNRYIILGNVRPLLAVRLDWVCSNILCSFEFAFATVPVKKKAEISCGGYEASINQSIIYCA
jgi:hypothetical protein